MEKQKSTLFDKFEFDEQQKKIKKDKETILHLFGIKKKKLVFFFESSLFVIDKFWQTKKITSISLEIVGVYSEQHKMVNILIKKEFFRKEFFFVVFCCFRVLLANYLRIFLFFFCLLLFLAINLLLLINQLIDPSINI